MASLIPMTLSLIDQRRLRWRCRRGMRELDRLFDRELDRLIALGDVAAIAPFERLLECEDDQLWRWCLGHERPIDMELATQIDAIRAHRPA
jgi:antitoxin CptB